MQLSNFDEDMNASLITGWCNNPQRLGPAVDAAKDFKTEHSLFNI